MRECCNTVDITPCSCSWAAAPGKWSDGREAVAVSNYKARLSLMYLWLVRPTDRLRRLLGLPTDNSHVAGGPVDLPARCPSPIGNLLPSSEPTPVTDSQLTRRPTAGGFAHRPSLNDRRCRPVVYHTSRQREIQCLIQRNFFESRESC